MATQNNTQVRGLTVDANVFVGIGYGLVVYGSGKLWSSKFSGNTVYDVVSGILFISDNTKHHQLDSVGNLYDTDPFLSNIYRGANGTWTSNGNISGIQMNNASGVVSSNDTFRNCCRVSDKAVAAATTGTSQITFHDARIDAYPTALGFSTSNKGVGECPRPGGSFWYRIVDCDPASANFGNVLNTCPRQSNAVPTSGYWIDGMFVESTIKGISASGMVWGWRRLGTGSNNVDGTDWQITYLKLS